MSGTVTRKNIRQLSRAELDKLVKAFAAIQALSPEDPDSFFVIAGYYGEPGRYANQGNVLFPTWHRAYLHRLEQALQKQVPGVALPYWDETEETTVKEGIPGVFLAREWTYEDGTVVPNPLLSYKLQKKVTDKAIKVNGVEYTKPEGYETVRFPFSGIVGTSTNKINTAEYNAGLAEEGLARTNYCLNDAVKKWLKPFAVFQGNFFSKSLDKGAKWQYEECLKAPNYTVFSNVTSAHHYNTQQQGADKPAVVALEEPCNAMRLAVGGFQVPRYADDYKVAGDGANGDMGENDTAAFDPLFFFHQCYADLLFAQWQSMPEAKLEIVAGDPGTRPGHGQGRAALTLDTPLSPFTKPGSATDPMTSRDVADTANLGYKYALTESPPSAATDPDTEVYTSTESGKRPASAAAPVLAVSGVDRAEIGGSFVLSAWAQLKAGEEDSDDEDGGSPVLVGLEPVVASWWNGGSGCTAGCSCRCCGGGEQQQQHNAAEVGVKPHVVLHGWTKAEVAKMEFDVRLHTRQELPAPVTFLQNEINKANGLHSYARTKRLEVELLTGHMQ